MQRELRIVHPIFLKCSVIVQDPVWKHIFTELAYGKSPSGTYFERDALCCRLKNKFFHYDFSEKSAEETTKEVIHIFQSKLKMDNQRQSFQQYQRMLDTLSGYSLRPWNELKKKNIRDVMFEQFVIDKKQEMGFTWKQTQRLLCMLRLALHFKVITVKDISFDEERGLISDISGIEISKTKLRLEASIRSASKIALPTRKTMKEMWRRRMKKQ